MPSNRCNLSKCETGGLLKEDLNTYNLGCWIVVTIEYLKKPLSTGEYLIVCRLVVEEGCEGKVKDERYSLSLKTSVTVVAECS